MIKRIVDWIEKNKVFSRKRKTNEQRALGMLLYRAGLSYRMTEYFVGASYEAVREWYQKGKLLFAEQQETIYINTSITYFRVGENMPAAVLGSRASGKTTFLGLLYAAQVKYGTGPDDTFRFHAPPTSLRIMHQIYSKMMKGSFPDATIKEQITNVSFRFGYKKLLAEKLPSWWVKRTTLWKNPFWRIDFVTYDVSGEDIQEFLETGQAPSGIIKQLFDSSIIVLLVDCSKMTVDKDTRAYHDMLHFDGQMAQLITSFATYKAKEQIPEKKVIYPVLILAKFDLMPKAVLHQLGLPPEFPPAKDERKREEYAETILRVFLPQTLAQLRGGRLVEVSFDRAHYLFSYVNTEKIEGMAPVTDAGPRVARVRDDKGVGIGIDFSYNEYVGFIEYFRKIAPKIPDEVVEEKELAPTPPPPEQSQA